MQILDPFERFAGECSLHLTAEPLCVAPRDVVAPIEVVEQHFLVSLSRPSSNEEPLRLIFLTSVAERVDPAVRDVLWWLAGDAWVLERGEGKLEPWAATYGYPSADEGVRWLFEQAVRQAAALGRLLGESNMRRLLALYEAAMAPPPQSNH